MSVVEPEVILDELAGLDPGVRLERYGVVALDFDLAALGALTPHPVYACMRWAQILSPTADQLARLRPLLRESLSLAKVKWDRRRPR